ALTQTVFYVINGLAITTNFIDIVYFRFTQKRMTIDVFAFADKNRGEIWALFPDFIRDFWFVFVIWIFFIALFVYVCRRVKIDYSRFESYRRKDFFVDFGKLFVLAILTVIAGRGGLQDKPVNIINAAEYTTPQNFPLVLNTPYTIMKTIDERGIDEKHYFRTEAILDAIYSPIHTPKIGDSITRKLGKINVMIIVLESFSAEHSAFLSPNLEKDYKGFTPFLDSLMKQSLAYHGFANGEISTAGIPSVVSSIPSLMSSAYLLSPYVSNEITSLPELLRKKNYATAFFHGGTNGTMGFQAYTKVAGFDKYYGRYEYNNEDDFDGNWGIFDEPFLQYTARTIDKMKKPFLCVVFTLSSHHPYTIPEKYKGKFRKGKLDIEQSIMYADYSLKKFFETARKMPWFENTLFVLTADHTSEAWHPVSRTSVGRYSIPIVFYSENENWKALKSDVVQQIDIMPSVLDYLGYDEKYLAYGESVFDTLAPRFAISYLNGMYQLIQNDYVYRFDGEKDISLYNYKEDSLLKNDLLGSVDSINNEMRQMTKAIIQQFNNRMIGNNLRVK
ncbi:MAG: LTA synthase family protein, partial [Chlorobi bacterium]|nr:LTA synthase family protein [Chlorobiota bacterium]